MYQWKKETDNTHTPFGYCGEYQDEETGLIYLRNRYYDPSIARFITEDPVRDGLNWYGYCVNNPVMFVDPWGLRNVVALVGKDKQSDYVFLNNTESFKKENPNDTVLTVKVWEDKYKSWNDVVKYINQIYGDSEIDAVIIAAHSNPEGIYFYGDNKINITKSTKWNKINFSDNANIRIMGCNAGGMAGFGNAIAEMETDKNGNRRFNGKLKDTISIAQTIANKTGATVWAFVNFTSQRYGEYGYYQEAVSYGEENVKFSGTFKINGGKLEVKNVPGHVEKKYQRFTKQQ